MEFEYFKVKLMHGPILSDPHYSWDAIRLEGYVARVLLLLSLQIINDNPGPFL
jgi:hypothetical protein